MIINFELLRFQKGFFFHAHEDKLKSRRFWITLVCRAFVKISVFVTNKCEE